MTMTLRRCDSLPTRLRDAPPAAPTRARPLSKKIPVSSTVPNFNDTPDREQVIATWKSLHTDVKKIKNGFLAKNGTNGEAEKKESITHNFIPAYACNNRDVRRKIYDRLGEVRQLEVDRSSSYPMDQVEAATKTHREHSVRRRTLLQRLLSWKTPECDCREQYIPKSRPTTKLRREDLLCTCGASAVRFNVPAKNNTFAERGRSKSVGYEAAREVTQFRRLVKCHVCSFEICVRGRLIYWCTVSPLFTKRFKFIQHIRAVRVRIHDSATARSENGSDIDSESLCE